MMRSLQPLLLIAILLLVAPGLARASGRVALVIGNSAYKYTPRLLNPKNDALAISGKLKNLGFEVVQGIDLDRRAFEQTIQTFSRRLRGAKVGLLFYAGHGLKVKGVNYLVPVDARLNSEDDLDFTVIPLSTIFKRMERLAGTNLAFLDACRNNPLARNLSRSMGTRGGDGVGRGLARVETGVGSLIAFATQPGNVALDGDGPNSPFTTALLKHIDKPGMDISLMLRLVRRDVIAATKGNQVPWENSSMTSRFLFKEAPLSQTSARAEPRSGRARKDKPDAALTDYKLTRSVGTCGAWKAFMGNHPDSFYASLAREEYRKIKCGAQERQSGTPLEPPGKTRTDTTDVAAIQPDTSAATPRLATPQNESERVALTISLQKELERVGCSPGAQDGQWGPQTRRALTAFVRRAGISLPTFGPSRALIEAIGEKTGRICPPPVSCEQGYRLSGETCVKNTKISRQGSKKTKKKKYWGGDDTRARCEAGFITADCFGD